MKSGRIIQKNLVFVDPADVPPTREAILKKDEIIVVRSGALTADSAIVHSKYEGAVAGYDMILTVQRAYPQFIAIVLLSNYMLADQLFRLKSRAAQPHLNAEELGNAIVVLPPTGEQKMIIENLDRKLFENNKAITIAAQEIDLIREHRNCLITDIVTGKIDVRHLKPRIVEAVAEIANPEENIDFEDMLLDEEQPDMSDDEGE